MKVLIVTQYFWPENFRINDLARELHKRGHAVTVLTGMPNYPSGRFAEGYALTGPYRERYDGIDVIRCPMVLRGSGNRLRLAVNYLSFAAMASIRGLLSCRGRYDVIFVHEPSPLTVCLPAITLRWRIGAPILLWILDLWPESLSATGAVRSSWVLNLVNRMVQMIYRHCDRILVQSRAFMPHVAQQRVPHDKLRYFPSWAETLYEATTAQSPLPDGVELPRGFRVMFAGNVGVAQDFATILNAAERLKGRDDIHWIILGDGRMFTWVRREIDRRNLRKNVHMLGRYPLESMPAFYAQADAMLVTLRRDPIFALTIPGKIQSYLAAGRPIVAALDGEGARIIEEAHAGYVSPAEDSERLAKAVAKMADDPPDARERMGRCAADYYRTHFERNMLFDRLEGWMQELAHDHRSAMQSTSSAGVEG